MANVTLKSSDETTISLPREAAELSPVIKEKLANNGNEVVVVNHNSNTLNNVVMFLRQQIIGSERAKKKMMRQFLYDSLRLSELFATALAAHDLGIKLLEDLMCESIAVKVKNVPVEDVRKEFETYTDLTSEQVAFTKTWYPWAFEGGDRNAPPAPPPSE